MRELWQKPQPPSMPHIISKQQNSERKNYIQREKSTAVTLIKSHLTCTKKKKKKALSNLEE